MAATDNQAGANAVTIQIADQDPQGTGLATATYENGQETKTGETQARLPEPGRSDLPHRRRPGPGGHRQARLLRRLRRSRRRRRLGAEHRRLELPQARQPDHRLVRVLRPLDAHPGRIEPPREPAPATDPGRLGPASRRRLPGADALTAAINDALSQAKSQFGDGGLVANLDMIEGRCTAGDGGPTGTSTLADAKLTFNIPGQDPITVLDAAGAPEAEHAPVHQPQ